MATHPEVTPRRPDVHERLVAAGLDVEWAQTSPDALNGVLAGRADVALVGIRALRDPVSEGLATLAVLPREDPRDVLVSAAVGASLAALGRGARIGVQGPRRHGFLLAHRSDLEPVKLLDGRLLEELLEDHALDGLVISALEARDAGWTREVREVLDPRAWLPEPGQGTVALVGRHPIAEAAALDHLPTRAELRAEIAFLEALNAPEQAPIGSLAQASGRWIRLWAAMVSENGLAVVRADATGPLDEPEALGANVARQLVERGADLLMDAVGR